MVDESVPHVSRRGDPTREDYIQRRSGTLFYPWDAQGERNEKAWAFIRDVDQELEKYEWYVATTVFGSTLKGYSTERSDVDLGFLVDGSTYTERVHSFEFLLSAVQAVASRHPGIVWDSRIGVSDLSLEGRIVREEKGDLSWLRDSSMGNDQVFLFAKNCMDLSWWITQAGGSGKGAGKGKQWRSTYRAVIRRLPQERRAELYEHVLKLIEDRELAIEKPASVYSGSHAFTAEDAKGLRIARRPLWEARLRELLDLSPSGDLAKSKV